MPHVAGLTNEARDKVYTSVADDVTRVLTGQPAVNFANSASPT